MAEGHEMYMSNMTSVNFCLLQKGYGVAVSEGSQNASEQNLPCQCSTALWLYCTFL